MLLDAQLFIAMMKTEQKETLYGALISKRVLYRRSTEREGEVGKTGPSVSSLNPFMSINNAGIHDDSYARSTNQAGRRIK